jgi:hypothetical protein
MCSGVLSRQCSSFAFTLSPSLAPDSCYWISLSACLRSQFFLISIRNAYLSRCLSLRIFPQLFIFLFFRTLAFTFALPPKEFLNPRILILRCGLLRCWVPWPIWIDPPAHSACCPHDLALRCHTANNGLRICSDASREVAVQENLAVGMPHDQIPQVYSHVPCCD